MASSASTLQDPIPRPSQQPPEVDYLQNRQNSFENTQTAFDVKKQQFVPDPKPIAVRQVTFDILPPPEHELQVTRTTESFQKAVERLKQKRGKENAIAKFSFENAHDWKGVDEIVKSAESKYVADDTMSGKIRKFFRKVGDNGRSIQSFVGLLPDGNYKTLCGGLTLILSAMISHSDIREKMAELMLELPEDIDDCEDYTLIYGRSSLLRQRVEELYVEILGALTDFVNWYMQGTARHIRDGLLRNQNYGQSIDLRIRDIRKARIRFQSATRKFLHRRLQMTQETGLETKEIAQNSQQSLTRIEGAVDDAKRGAQETGLALMRRMSGLETQVLNGVQSMLADQTRNAKCESARRYYPDIESGLTKSQGKKQVDVLKQAADDKDQIIAQLRSRVNEASYKPSSLAEALDLDLSKDGYPDDIGFAYSQGVTETPQFQDRTRWVAESSDFTSWLHTDGSEVLVIQGQYSELECISPMSFLVALLYPKLADSRDVLVLPFFCGLHTGSQFDDSDEPSGPLLMARALLTQLLNIKTVNWADGNAGLPFLPLNPDDVKKLKSSSFSAYVKLIGKLIVAMKNHHSAIFIIIDGLDYYDLTWPREAKCMVKTLLKIATSAEETTGAVVKIMFAAGTHTNGWPQEGSGAVVLDVPDEIDGDGDTLEDLDSE